MKIEEMLQVTSSNIQRIGHKENNLYVQFNSGAVYIYKDVPESVYQELLNAESKGKFINANIKGKYSFEKSSF